MSQELVEAISDMREEDALRLTREMLDRGENPARILDDTRAAMALVGQRFEAGKYFVPELVYAGEILRQISDVVKPKLAATSNAPKIGTVVIGTVQGDIHDIGKDIVTFMLDVNGFEVHDLGVDVPPQKFVDAVREFQPQVVGLSGFLTLAFDSMKETVEAIQAAGLRDQVKIMIGGGQVGEEIRAFAGADGFGKDAAVGVTLAKKWVGAD